MTAVPIPDGDLPGARDRLHNAIHNLIEPRLRHTPAVDPTLEYPDPDQATHHWEPSLYTQLQQSIPGQQGSGEGIPRSLPALWLDAADLLNEIDTAVAIWENDPYPPLPSPWEWAYETLVPHTIMRIRRIEKRKWRPQDVRNIDQLSAAIESWCASITQLLHPTPSWTLPNPCPACGTAVVYRRDTAGEMVRKPALQIGPHGCECAKCRHNWSPQLFVHLSRVLGYDLPAGVLE